MLKARYPFFKLLCNYKIYTYLCTNDIGIFGTEPYSTSGFGRQEHIAERLPHNKDL